MRRRISIIILSLALLLLFPTTIHGADTSGDTGNVNFIVISALHKVDGKYIVPYDYSVSFAKGQTKTLKEGSPLSMFGKKDYQFGYMGVEYKFLNGVYLADTSASCGQAPIYSESLDETQWVYKVNYKGDNTFIITYKDGHTDTIDNTNTINLVGVYSQTQSWFLDYNYIDEISTG